MQWQVVRNNWGNFILASNLYICIYISIFEIKSLFFTQGQKKNILNHWKISIILRSRDVLSV